MIFQYILRMIRSGWKLILACGLIGLAISLVISLNTLPLYRTEATFIISPSPNLPSSRDAVSALAALDTMKIFDTYGEVLTSQRVYDAALQQLALTAQDLKEYQRHTALRPNSIILGLTVDGPDPALAVQLANALGQKGIEFINAYYDVFQINFLDQASQPVAPFTPQPVRHGLLAAGIGLLAGLVIAIFREQLRTPLATFLQSTRIDKQSGVFNRKYFMRLLEREVLEHKDEVFSVSLIELEGLRDVIDVLPEFEMANILKQVTDLLRNQLRGNDIIARWDKRTFALLLPGTPEEPARRTVDRVLAALARQVAFGANQEETVDLLPTAGLTTRGQGESVQEMINQTESKLRKATEATYEPLPEERKRKQ